MKKTVFALVCLALAILVYPRVFSFVYRMVPPKLWNERIAYGQVRDICHPRDEDYAALQKFLTYGKRPALAQLGDMEKRVRNLRLIEEREKPEFGKVAVNCSPEERENCLIVYASLHKSYPKALKKFVETVANSDFKGHILYRIGGWPNTEEGDLKLAHVPYAFKPCFFREAKRLGYQRALWVDTSITPVVNLNQIFETIKTQGYFAIGNGQFVGPFINQQAAISLGVTLQECTQIPSVSPALFGVDFSDEKGALAIEKWFQAAKAGTPFFSPRSDQNVISVILYQLEMSKWAPPDSLVEAYKPISKSTLFTIDRRYVQNWK